MTSMAVDDGRTDRPGGLANLHAALDACLGLDEAARILRRDIEERSGLDAEAAALPRLSVRAGRFADLRTFVSN